jgi:hypothetical protein
MDFLMHVKAKCKEADVKFLLSNTEYVETGQSTRCNGYFDGDNKVLAVAVGQPEEQWNKILVHEYAHMTQWMDDSPAWKAGTEGTDAETLVELWYNREIEMTAKQKAKWIGLGRDLEREAEERAVQLIGRFNLPLSPKAYIRNANAYLYFWTFSGIIRRWYKIGKEPYNIPQIIAAMPETLDVDHAVLPKTYERLYRRYC